MKGYGFILVLTIIAIVVEHLQHKEYAQKHPDYDECPSGVIGLVIIAIFLVINLIR